MIDISKFPCHKKPYADSTLWQMKKDELIGILRDYEHNYGALHSLYENSVKNAEALLKAAEGITLDDLLAAIEPGTGVFIVHHMGADISEAGGTVEELLASAAVKKCGGNHVKRITLDVEDWPDTPTPTLIVTIGNKEERRRGHE